MSLGEILQEAIDDTRTDNKAERLEHYLSEMQDARMKFIEAKDRQTITEGRLLEELIAQGRIECLTIRHSALRRVLQTNIMRPQVGLKKAGTHASLMIEE